MSVTEMPFTRMTEAEWQTRLDLAACYRLVDLFGWSDLINTRITARVPGPHDHFLINPYGLLFEEVTASSLVKIDASLGELFGPRLAETIAGYLIMLLVLVPYFAFRVLDEALGEGRVARMFFVEREPIEQRQAKPGVHSRPC